MRLIGITGGIGAGKTEVLIFYQTALSLQNLSG